MNMAVLTPAETASMLKQKSLAIANLLGVGGSVFSASCSGVRGARKRRSPRRSHASLQSCITTHRRTISIRRATCVEGCMPARCGGREPTLLRWSSAPFLSGFSTNACSPGHKVSTLLTLGDVLLVALWHAACHISCIAMGSRRMCPCWCADVSRPSRACQPAGCWKPISDVCG